MEIRVYGTEEEMDHFESVLFTVFSNANISPDELVCEVERINGMVELRIVLPSWSVEKLSPLFPLLITLS